VVDEQDNPMTATVWLIVALVVVLAVLLAAVAWAACVVGGACDVRMDEGDYADEAGDDVP
jgi:hypothetical protein